MKANRVFREGVEIYLMDGQAFVAYFYLLMILGPLEFLVLFLPSLDPQIWVGPANLFKVSSVAAMILILYFGSKIINQEYVPWRFYALKRWIHQEGLGIAEIALGQLSLLCLYMFSLLLLSSPLLIWAGAISRAPVVTILTTLSLLSFYSLAYGVWALVALSVWELRTESRQIFVRFFLLVLVFLTALIYLPLNPVAFLLSYLERKDLSLSAHFLFHFLLLGSGLALYFGTLKRKERNP